MNWQEEALVRISAQVHNCEHMLFILLQHQQVELPPELIKAREDLAVKRKALQAALDAQAQQTPQQ